MATLKNINGPFIGKVGTVVGSSWLGKYYIKSLPKKRAGKVSKKEMANRQKFAASQAWLQPLTDFVRAGFKGYAPLSQGFVAAKSWLLKNAIDADGKINPALVKVSHGNLPLPLDIAVSINNSVLEFSWDPALPAGASAEDQAMVVAYDIENGYADYTINGQLRNTGHHELKLHYEKKQRTYHIYFAMIAADRSRQSDSVYLGSMIN